jgi:hypothetical protein
VLSGGVHILVAQHVRHQVDIAGLVIEIGAEGAAQLVGTQVFFQRRCLRGVFLDHHLHGTYGNAPVLKG